MKNGTIAALSLLAACTDYVLRDLAESAPQTEAPPASAPEPSEPATVLPVDAPCGVVELVMVSATPSPGFQSDGVLELVLIPRDADGNVVLDCDWSVVAAADSTLATGVTSVVAIPQDPLPTVFALDFDSSGSMSGADPEMLRIPAAQTFISLTEAARPENLHGVFTFPRENVFPFVVTEMLAAFTDDAAAARAAVATLGVPSGFTPLFESAVEVLGHQDDVTGPDFRTALVLFSDGQPSDVDFTIDDLLGVAAATGTTIHTVGLGVASQTGDSPNADAIEVMQRLAFETGGSYSSATEASDLEATFTNLAASLAGHIVVTIVFAAPPAAGVFVSGTISVEDVGSTWSFIAP